MDAIYAITIMREHIGRWHNLMNKAAKNDDSKAAQSYADMIYGVRAMIEEIERKIYAERTPASDPNIVVGVSCGLVHYVICNIPGATCRVYDEDCEDYTEDDEKVFDRLFNDKSYHILY